MRAQPYPRLGLNIGFNNNLFGGVGVGSSSSAAATPGRISGAAAGAGVGAPRVRVNEDFEVEDLELDTHMLEGAHRTHAGQNGGQWAEGAHSMQNGGRPSASHNPRKQNPPPPLGVAQPAQSPSAMSIASSSPAPVPQAAWGANPASPVHARQSQSGAGPETPGSNRQDRNSGVQQQQQPQEGVTDRIFSVTRKLFSGMTGGDDANNTPNNKKANAEMPPASSGSVTPAGSSSSLRMPAKDRSKEKQTGYSSTLQRAVTGSGNSLGGTPINGGSAEPPARLSDLVQPTAVAAREQLSFRQSYSGSADYPFRMPMHRLQTHPHSDMRTSALRSHYRNQSFAGRANVFYRDGPKQTVQNIQRFFGETGFFGKPYVLEKPKKYCIKKNQ